MSETSTTVTKSANAFSRGGRFGPSFASELRFDNVGYRIDDHDILRSVGFRVKPGTTVCLLGPSGCGKSTTLRLAAGILQPTRGQIFLDAQEIAGPSKFLPPEKRNIGLMFQDYALFPHLSVIDNVAYGLYAMSRGDAHKIAMQTLERIGLGEKAKLYPNALSGGEQQRVALARAIVPRPQIILMDEPFSGLDQRLRDAMRRETVQLLTETQSSAVFVTHDPLEAMEMADEIILLRQGQIIQQGPPDQFHNAPADAGVVRFFGDVNTFEGIASKGTVETPLGNFSAKGFADGTKLDVLIRPTAIVPAQKGIEGLVLESRFLGTIHQAKVLFASGAEPLNIMFGTDHELKIGQTSRFSVNSAQVYVFKST